ncbi:hypothetical protein Droror1_Dr00010813 [Drosera rotundifolia]
MRPLEKGEIGMLQGFGYEAWGFLAWKMVWDFVPFPSGEGGHRLRLAVAHGGVRRLAAWKLDGDGGTQRIAAAGGAQREKRGAAKKFQEMKEKRR